MKALNYIRVFINRNFLPSLLFLIGLVLWWVVSLFLDDYQASVGPDFLSRLPIKLIYLAAAIFMTRVVIRFMFPSIYEYTDTKGGTQDSAFRRDWYDGEYPSYEDKPKNQTNPRLWISVLVYIGSFIAVSQLLLSA